MIFTGNKNIDIDINILLELTDKRLGIICQTNKYSYHLCDNYFWSLKLNKIYPDISIPLKYKYNIQNFYIEISPFIKNFDGLVNCATQYGYLEVLNWLAVRGVFPDITNSNLAVANGHIEVLKWIYEYNSLAVPDVEGANYEMRRVPHLQQLF